MQILGSYPLELAAWTLGSTDDGEFGSQIDGVGVVCGRELSRVGVCDVFEIIWFRNMPFYEFI